MPTNTKPLTAERIAELVELYPKTTQGKYSIARIQEHDGALKKVLVGSTVCGPIAQFKPIRTVPPKDDQPLTLSMYEQETEADAEWYALAHNAMPGLIGMLAEKDRELAQEKVLRESWTNVFGSSVIEASERLRIAEQMTVALRAELQQKDATLQAGAKAAGEFAEKCYAEQSRLTAELQQANERIAELESQLNYEMSNDEANRLTAQEAAEQPRNE